MAAVDAHAWDGHFVVVETEDDWYLGTIRVSAGMATIYTGRTGRPPVLDMEDIESVTPVEEHPHVERTASRRR